MGAAHFFGRDKPSDALQSVKNSSFRFFCSKVDYLLRHNEIHYMVGLPKHIFEMLLSICKHNARSKCSAPVQLAVFLKFVKEGLTQNALSREIGLSQSSISRIVTSIVSDLVKVSPQYIKFPTTKEEILSLTSGFFNKADRSGEMRRMPCYGVLDGKHWKCQHPPHSGALNRNYKASFSFNSLFVADSESRILYCQISKLGINNYSQLLDAGLLPQLLAKAAAIVGIRTLPDSDTVMPPFVLADNGFGLSKYVMQPYRSNKLTSENIKFNEKISATRVKIENLFGILTSKFQIFQRDLQLDPTNSRCLIVACAVIHNITLGPLQLIDSDVDDSPVIIDPYPSAEHQRSALKSYILRD